MLDAFDQHHDLAIAAIASRRWDHAWSAATAANGVVNRYRMSRPAMQPVHAAALRRAEEELSNRTGRMRAAAGAKTAEAERVLDALRDARAVLARAMDAPDIEPAPEPDHRALDQLERCALDRLAERLAVPEYASVREAAAAYLADPSQDASAHLIAMCSALLSSAQSYRWAASPTAPQSRLAGDLHRISSAAMAAGDAAARRAAAQRAIAWAAEIVVCNPPRDS